MANLRIFMYDLFEQLKADGESAIDRWIEEKRGESLNFDCKLKENPTSPGLDNSDRRNLAKALSAFANSDGGLLLWGVDARGKGGVDCLVAKKPISNIRAFANTAEQAVSDLISPPIPGLEFLKIASADDPVAGYLAIWIPSSERRPHMSRARDERTFYFRNGHQSLAMEVFQVRDQMLRKTVPQLELVWDMRVRNGEISEANLKKWTVPVSVQLGLKNVSLSSARFPYLLIDVNKTRYGELGHEYRDIARNGLPIERTGPIDMRQIAARFRTNTQNLELSGNSDCCIHPGTTLWLASIRLDAPAEVNRRFVQGYGVAEFLDPDYGKLLTVICDVSFGCQDALNQRLSLELTAQVMLEKFQTNGEAGGIQVRF